VLSSALQVFVFNHYQIAQLHQLVQMAKSSA